MEPIKPNPPFMPLAHEGFTAATLDVQKTRLKAQVEDFASLLYAQMFEQMRESGKGEEEDEGNSVFGGGDTSMFMHFLDESVGRNFIKQGGGGLNDALLKQLSTRLDTQAQGGDR
jgi:Rod binding domain-containing protein